MTDEKVFFTVLEISKILQISKMTVYRLLNEGKLPSIKVGRSFRIHKDEVEKLLKDGVS